MSAAMVQLPVYIVDDDDAVRASCEMLLGSLGYPVHGFASGRAFLAAVDVTMPGCVILDIGMPGIDGLVLHQRLQSAHSPLAVVFLTGRADVPTAVDAMRHGAFDYLVKPVRSQQLVDAVNRALRRTQAEAEHLSSRREVEARLARLTARERDVLGEIVGGDSYRVIAGRLDVSPRTLEAHRKRIMTKMGARSLPELLRALAKAGWSGAARGTAPPAAASDASRR
jgi:FixJ family two-component response regulator